MVNDLLIAMILCLSLWLFFLFLRGKRSANIISNDNVLLRSERLGLVGRPDRIIEGNGTWIPIEKKSGLKLQDSHIMQLAVYLILIEDVTVKSSPYGYIELGNGKRHKIKNTAKLRTQAWTHIHAVREIKNTPKKFVKATAFPAKCRSCSYKHHCNQA